MKYFYGWLKGKTLLQSLLFSFAAIVTLVFSTGAAFVMRALVVNLFDLQFQVGSLEHSLVGLFYVLTYFVTAVFIGTPFIRGVMTGNWIFSRFDQWEAKA